MIKGIIFDLDGTLLDSLEDLYLSTNYALNAMGYPARSLEEIRQFVGNGIAMLIRRAVPAECTDEDATRCLNVFRGHYLQHCHEHTRPYEGIADMLMTLKNEGWKTAIVSNKLQDGVTQLHHQWFAKVIDTAIGEQPGIRRKPDPDMVRKALAEMHLSVEESVYIGDSETDIETARNTGCPCISVLWGFRSRETLLRHGATSFAETPEALLQQIRQINKGMPYGE